MRNGAVFSLEIIGCPAGPVVSSMFWHVVYSGTELYFQYFVDDGVALFGYVLPTKQPLTVQLEFDIVPMDDFP